MGRLRVNNYCITTYTVVYAWILLFVTVLIKFYKKRTIASAIIFTATTPKAIPNSIPT